VGNKVNINNYQSSKLMAMLIYAIQNTRSHFAKGKFKKNTQFYEVDGDKMVRIDPI
jgi:hypothetical protein